MKLFIDTIFYISPFSIQLGKDPINMISSYMLKSKVYKQNKYLNMYFQGLVQKPPGEKPSQDKSALTKRAPIMMKSKS